MKRALARVRGAVPIMVQALGVVMAAWGLYGLVGPKWSLLIVGVLGVVVGTLVELRSR